MAITRSQQAKQMLQDGGMLVKPGNGKRPGYRGPGEYQGGATNQGGAGKDTGVDKGPSGDGGNRFTQFTKDVLNPQTDTVTQKFTGRSNLFGGANRFGYTDLRPDGSLKPGFGGRVLGGLMSLLTGIPVVGGAIGSMYDKGKGFFAPKKRDMSEFNKLGLYTDQFPTEDDDDDGTQLSKNFDDAMFVNALTTPTAGKFGLNLVEYNRLRNNRYNDSQIKEAIKGGYVKELLGTLALATGGRVGLMGGGMPYEGGIMDLESARQMYGLGKLVKKVTRTVKKIAKSPIGKAALLYTGAGGLGNLAAGQSFFSNFARPGFLGNVGSIFSKGGLENIMAKAKLGKFVTSYGDQAPVFEKNILGKALTSPFGLITAASALAGLLTPEQEEEAQALAQGEGIDIEAARRSILNAGTPQDQRALSFRAEGGPAEGKEPVAKKTMPLLDMDGKEMDLRAEGGFVPIGRMEKADDVPARLSKNEFVCTADAVRNAGDGDVDKGAEVMYNMMKNLEAGGDVSEESQGLEGARKMFQTSQRLEEVL